MKEFLQYIEKNNLQDREAFINHCEQVLQLKVKEDGRFILLDYDQINSPRKHEFVDFCRGLIFDWDTQTIACRPFKRFYNYGEYPEVESAFEWGKATVDSKEDGSLIKCWFNHRDDRWEIGTRGSMYGDNTISTLSGEEGEISFRELFLRALGVSEATFQSEMNRLVRNDYTALFELCCIENKVVTAYTGDNVFLLGMISNVSGYEISQAIRNIRAGEFGNVMNVKSPEKFDVSTFDGAVKAANSLGGLREGFVIFDGTHRMKIKSAAYVTAHHLRGGGVTQKRAVLLALAGEVPEFLSYFPEYTILLTPYQENVNKIQKQIDEVFDAIKGIESQKDFAIEATKYKFSGVLFQMRKGLNKDSVISNLSDGAKVSIFG